MSVRKIKDGVYAVGVNHWDRKLFDEIIPLPNGTSYNSYLIIGSQYTALIDTVDPALQDGLINNLKEFKDLKVDYIISQHAEQDHSGSIPKILEMYPDAKVVTNEKCKELLIEHLGIPDEKFIVIKDYDKLSLGNKTLTFIFTPWVHWPETMSTYLQEDKILFTCDFFGSHYATSELYAKNSEIVLEGAKRYYAEIMMPFRNFIKSNINKIEKFDFEIIAPSHGPMWNDPKFIINAYLDWISPVVKNEVVVLYTSMHGSTKVIVDELYNRLVENGIKVTPFNLVSADLGEIAISLVDAATIIFAFPTVLTGPHPLGASITYFVNAIKPKTKFASFITSYGWGGMTIKWVKEHIGNLKVEMLGELEFKGLPKKEDIEKVNEIVMRIVEAHKSIGIL
ncbi:FprA family A-type flavoprotein [Caldisericum exile]|uniref:Flavoprotein n=1 Tax=Caldisericum exile (strain DSM 21853 / NBRC 104410 / AZM16c01) TaxID=511051 RepID=A0A7U6JH41_CALEA|nr:FprA family A-type flavoprotein [Caldisericum exile]BAL81367.1 putative flavoprotein [Caldisericum exile AZM16c01]